jgi:enoyl-CoA hydratase
MPGSVSWRLEGTVAVLSFDNPGRLNAIDQAIANGLVQAVEEISASREAGALLIRGAGSKAFSAGIDLKYADGTGDRASAFAAIDERIERLRYLLAASELPVICMMSGVCYGCSPVLRICASLRAICASRCRRSTTACSIPLRALPGWSRSWACNMCAACF